jgi:hypothetical protein
MTFIICHSVLREILFAARCFFITVQRVEGGQKGHKGKRLNIPGNLDGLVGAGKAEHTIVYDGVARVAGLSNARRGLG